MRIVVQRVSEASVDVDGARVAGIGRGLLVLLGVGSDDGAADVEYVTGKIRDLRVFEDEQGKMNRSLVDVQGSVLLVSLLLTYYVSPYFVWLTAFVGFNLIQSAFTGFCPAAIVFRKLGVKPGTAF